VRTLDVDHGTTRQTGLYGQLEQCLPTVGLLLYELLRIVTAGHCRDRRGLQAPLGHVPKADAHGVAGVQWVVAVGCGICVRLDDVTLAAELRLQRGVTDDHSADVVVVVFALYFALAGWSAGLDAAVVKAQR